MNQYQRYFTRKLVSSGCSVLVPFQAYLCCERCAFSLDDTAELEQLFQLLQKNHSVSTQSFVLIYHDCMQENAFFADTICVIGNAQKVVSKINKTVFEPECIGKWEDLYLEDPKAILLKGRTQSVIDLQQENAVCLLWE